MSTPDNIIFDWNQGNRHSPPLKRVELFDETLRDGIQCPSITDPPIEKKLEILRLLDAIGVDEADIALPGAGKRAVEDCTTMVEMIRDEGLNIRPAAAARTSTRGGPRRFCWWWSRSPSRCRAHHLNPKLRRWR